jgi:glutamine amidotransferase
MITIIDYQTGNLGSLLNMIKKIGFSASVSSSPDEIIKAKALILPGVGAFDTGMENLEKSRVLPVLHRKVIEEKTPILGICLGMQLLGDSSAEGHLPGLGWIPGKSVRFKPDTCQNLKVPHMGWNSVMPLQKDILFSDMAPRAMFYFVHSFYFQCDNNGHALALSEYGHPFTCALKKDNIRGVQFHPEKSLTYGMTLLRNFLREVA